MNFVPTRGSLWPPANIMQIQVNFDAMTTQGKHCQQLVGNEEIQNHPMSETNVFVFFAAHFLSSLLWFMPVVFVLGADLRKYRIAQRNETLSL